MNDGGNGLEGREIEKIWVEPFLDLDLFKRIRKGKSSPLDMSLSTCLNAEGLSTGDQTRGPGTGINRYEKTEKRGNATRARYPCRAVPYRDHGFHSAVSIQPCRYSAKRLGGRLRTDIFWRAAYVVSIARNFQRDDTS
jgi:hypothetical protein